MKIAVIGAGYTGKTTVVLSLANQLVHTGPAVAVVPDAAHDWRNDHPNVSADVWPGDPRAQREIQLLALDRERQWEDTDRLMLCDRSVLCPAVYLAAHGNHNAAAALLNNTYDVDKYNRIYVCDPADVPYPDDIAWVQADADRFTLHAAYLSYLDQWDIPYRHLKGSVDDRVSTVLGDIA